MNRHQFHTVHTQLLQIGYLLHDACKRTLVLHARACATGKVAHVHLIHDEVVHGCLQWHIALPVKVVEHHSSPILVQTVPVGLLSPHITPHDEFCIRIQQNLRLVEPVALLRTERPIHAEAIFYVLEIQVEHDHREHIAQPELLEERYLHKGLLLVIVEQHQGAIGGIARVYREIHHVAKTRCPKGMGPASAQFQPLVLVRGEYIYSMHNRRDFRNP